MLPDDALYDGQLGAASGVEHTTSSRCTPKWRALGGVSADAGLVLT
jgi:hypothetical protein